VSPSRRMAAATAAPAPAIEADLADTLEPGETILLMARPSPLLVPLGPLVSILWIAVLSLFLAWLDRRFDWIPWRDNHVLLLGVVLASARLGWQAAEWTGRLYVLTDRRVVRRGGLGRAGVQEILLVDLAPPGVFRNPAERFAGAGTVSLERERGGGFAWEWVSDPESIRQAIADARSRYGRR
jgi:hypothetical protein